ncbi:MAG: hypothetical protein AB7O66_24285, partial [Limisphaerales bacterium]
MDPEPSPGSRVASDRRRPATTAVGAPVAQPLVGTSFDRRLHASYRQIGAVRQWLVRHVTPAGAFLFWAMLAAGA